MLSLLHPYAGSIPTLCILHPIAESSVLYKSQEVDIRGFGRIASAAIRGSFDWFVDE